MLLCKRQIIKSASIKKVFALLHLGNRFVFIERRVYSLSGKKPTQRHLFDDVGDLRRAESRLFSSFPLFLAWKCSVPGIVGPSDRAAAGSTPFLGSSSSASKKAGREIR